MPSLLLLMIENDEEETAEVDLRKLRRCTESVERVFKVDELGVEGVIKDGAALEGDGGLQGPGQVEDW